MTYHAKLVAGGKVAVPAALRRELGLNTGDTLVFTAEGDSIRVRSYATVIRDVQRQFRDYVPAGTSVVDDFIAERRAEAARE